SCRAGCSTGAAPHGAAARALFGQVAAGGRLPVSVPGIAKLGDGLPVEATTMKWRRTAPATQARLEPAFEALDRAGADQAFPGGRLAGGYRGGGTGHAFGHPTFEANSPNVQPDTIYDAASLSKPVVTTTLIAMLVAAGRLELDAPIERYLPEWAAGPNPEWRHPVTLRHLLTHTSGLPAHKPYFESARNK